MASVNGGCGGPSGGGMLVRAGDEPADDGEAEGEEGVEAAQAAVEAIEALIDLREAIGHPVLEVVEAVIDGGEAIVHAFLELVEAPVEAAEGLADGIEGVGVGGHGVWEVGSGIITLS